MLMKYFGYRLRSVREGKCFEIVSEVEHAVGDQFVLCPGDDSEPAMVIVESVREFQTLRLRFHLGPERRTAASMG
jgi:hypothetical protein